MQIYTSAENFTVTIADGIAWIAMDRPQKANAFSLPMWHELGAVFEACDQDPAVRVAVLCGRGKHFTAGIDLSLLRSITTELETRTAGHQQEYLVHFIKNLQAQISALERCRKPVIAAIHGQCIGGGIDIISACDIRFACTAARFAVKEIDLAIVADVGTVQRLPRIVGEGTARELAFTGREFSAAEAATMRLVNHVLPDQEALYSHAREVASLIASKSPIAIRGLKESLNYSRDHSVAAGLAEIAQRNAALLLAPDVQEATRALQERRPAKFADS